MPAVSNVNDLPELPQMLAERIVSARPHPSAPLKIYNYTARAQYDAIWNATTLACRGLIADHSGNIVARPFSKFFNLEQVPILPDEPFEVFEKLDGSLGILYWLGDTPQIATRGSFDSEQAQAANRMLAKYDTSNLARGLTYLFEIIYPANRIVIDYGAREELVLLAIIDTASGEELPLSDVGFPIVTKYEGVTDVASLRTLEKRNAEGFVVRFKSGFRVKVKFGEYVRLHKLLTNVSEKDILEFLKTGADLNTMLEMVPDEFYAWAHGNIEKFRKRYAEIEAEARRVFASIQAPTRKEFAAAALKTPYSTILFNMLDKRDCSEAVLEDDFGDPGDFQ